MKIDEPCKRFFPEKVDSLAVKLAHVFIGLTEVDHNLINEIHE